MAFYFPMNPVIKREWLTDLYSELFPQSFNTLRNTDGYCCWGVLCEQGVHEGILSAHRGDFGTYNYKTLSNGQWYTELPSPETMVWAGIEPSIRASEQVLRRHSYTLEEPAFPVRLLERVGVRPSDLRGPLDDGVFYLSTLNDSRIPFPVIGDLVDYVF